VSADRSNPGHPQQIVVGTKTLMLPPVLLGFAVLVAKLFE
jgi:hypothetical protein